MSVDAYFDQSFYPGMGGGPVDPDTPVITFPVDGLTVPPVHDVRGTALPGQTVTLWSALSGNDLVQHAEVTAEADGSFTFAGEQITGRNDQVATFEVRTDTGTSADVTVTVRGPVVTGVLPETIAAEVLGAFILTGDRFLTMTRTMEVQITDPGGAVRRVPVGSVTATQVTFDAEFPAEGEASVLIAQADGGHTMTDAVTVTVTPAAEALDDEPEPEPDEDPEP
jgi:hypothetical protein